MVLSSPHASCLRCRSRLALVFKEETNDGWWFRDTRRHWHYWLSHVLPVVIVLYNPETNELFWQHADASLVQLTGEEGKQAAHSGADGPDTGEAVLEVGRGPGTDLFDAAEIIGPAAVLAGSIRARS